MKTKKMQLASILLGLVMALSLMPGLAIAEGPDSGVAGGELQTAASKPSQAIQATHMPVFVGDQGKSLNARVVEGNGGLSYAVKSGGDCVSVDSNGALTFRKAGKAIVTVTAAATNEYAETSIDVPITIYDHFDYTFTVGNTLDCVDYYGHYPINKLEIKLKGWENVLGSGTINSPQRGSKTTISATGFAKRIEMKAEIQQGKGTRSASETLNLNGGGRFEIDMNSRGTIVMCDYGITLPEPDFTAPVAKPNLTATGNNQLLIYPGSVLSGGQHMEYTFGTKDAPNNNGWTDNYGFMRAKDPGDYYVWWKTASRDRRSLMYFSGGRLDTAPQCVKVTIGKGSINPTVSIDGWTYGETPKTPTVSGNTGNGAVAYEYKVRGADDSTYTETVPENAGDYTVRATIADSTTHFGGSATKDFTITKATLPPQNVRVVGYVHTVDNPSAHWEANIEQSLAGMMPNDAGTLDYAGGTPIYNGGATALPAGVAFTSNVDPSNGVVTAKLEIPSTATDIPTEVQEITLPVTVASQNYEDATINVVMVPTKRSEKQVTISNAPTSKTYGDGAFALTATVEGGETGENNWYWYSSNPQVLEVDAENGSSQMQVHVRGAGSAQILAWYEPSGGNTIGAAVTNAITVDKAGINPSVSIDGWTYGGTPKAPIVAGNTGNGAVTYSYSGTTRAETAFGPSASAPTQAGTYTVTATVAETDNYRGNTCTKEFAIAPKPVPVTVTAEDKTYDGTANVNVFATMKASDLVDGDLIEGATVYEDGTVGFPGLSGAFTDANAGQNKPITLDISGVTYPVAETSNYEAGLINDPTATIEPRPVYVKADDKTSRHGESIVALTYSLDDPTGLIGSDTLESLGITASTEASSSSNVGTYPITLAGGTANPNYNACFVEGGTYTITKAQGLTKSIRVVGILSSDDAAGAWVASIEQPLAGMMSNDAGTLTYAAGTDTMPAGIESYNVDALSGKVTAKLKIKPTESGGIPTGMQEITLPVTVKSQNYEDSTINVVVVPTLRSEKTVTIEDAPTSKTYGDANFTLTAIVNDDQAARGDWYWYSSDPSVLEVPAITDPNTGSNTVNVTVHNPGSAMILAWYEPSDPSRQYIGAALTEPITVNKLSISPSVSIDGWKYGEAPKAPVLAEGSNPGGCTVTYAYKAKGADDSAYTEDIPTEAGNYTVRATVPEATYYRGGACTADFTIAKIPVDATVTAKDKTYDGTTDATVSATVSAGLLEGDSVTVSGLKGTFSDAKAGEGKTVAIDRTGATFTGVGAANYEVTIPATTTAAIAKADLSKAKVTTVPASYAYDGKAKKPAVKVTLNGKVLDLKAGTDYKLTYKNNKKIGTATVTVAGKGSCTGTKSAKFKIKMANALTVKVAKASVKASSKASTVRPIAKVTTWFKTTVTYAKATTAKAKKLNGYEVLSVNKKTGKVTVKAGAKPGTYKLKVKVTAAETAKVKDASKTVTVTVKVTGKAKAKSLKAQSATPRPGTALIAATVA